MTGTYTPPGQPWTPPGEWIDDARCRLEIYLPVFDHWQETGKDPQRASGRRQLAEAEAAAKAICHACPVLTECRRWIDGNELGRSKSDRLDGIVAGLTPDERGLARKGTKGKPIVHGTNAGYYVHLRRRETACTECKDAATRHSREQKAAKAKSEASRSVTGGTLKGRRAS